MVAQLINPVQRLDVGGYTTAPVSGFTVPAALRAALAAYSPRTHLGRIIRATFAHLPADLAGELLDAVMRVVVLESELALTVLRGQPRTVEHYGVVGRKVITDTGVGFLVDAWQNLVEMEAMKYHGLGTGSTAEAAGQTALVTELTTEYDPDSTRATGTTAEGASANIFSTVATNTLNGTPGAALREHGLFSAASAGVLWDRTVYAAITLSSGDALQSTYQMTATSGG